jgi:hypothetical protein
MSHKEISEPWSIPFDRLAKRCIAVKTADGVIREVHFYHDGGRPTLRVPTMGAHFDAARSGWHLLGWTFYERVEPLVWEGEMVAHCPAGLCMPGATWLPKWVSGKRFKVTITEIVEGVNEPD